ncbi:hypothetical protein F1559_001151 [Cyanidiococcus yangmingshanensis]|uniref:Uncharacterized protein n=1 Tax=Cyanidiococcus yangmingshanensis TaxID=2690220 RepID=A0A7J7IND0_9RHOD|nr:hypothetical protein F1559_001151 [Cyanidiococcus yangmingshanensis]
MSFAMSHYALMLIETFRDALTADNQIQPDMHGEGLVGLTTSISLVDDLSRLPPGPLRNVRPRLRQLGRQIEEKTNESTEVEMASDLSSATLGLLFALLEGASSNAGGYLERTWPDLLTAFGAVLARGHMLPASSTDTADRTRHQWFAQSIEVPRKRCQS